MPNDWLNRCHFGDVRAVLRKMIADGVQVQTIVTSPPYWALRSYLPAGHPDKVYEIGSEPTIHEWVRTMVEVFDLCRDVLRDDGTMWLNFGDSYAANRGAGGPASGDVGQRAGQPRATAGGFKPKDLMGQPWRAAFALQDAGWWLRQDIVWNKPNPMPESTRDRCTKAHEYIFLLSKSERYYYDFDAMQEPVSGTANARRARPVGWATEGSHDAGDWATMQQQGRGAGWRERALAEQRTTPKTADRAVGGKSNPSYDVAMKQGDLVETRNRRSVWTVPSEPYKGSHFATFPRKLIEPCILAGCPVGGTVLDIFFGSGTTGQVAQALGRNFIGIDLNEANKPLQDERLRQPSLIFEEPLHDEAERDVA